MRKSPMYDELEARGLLSYGNHIPSRIIHGIMQVEIPKLATKQEFDRLSLEELKVMGNVRWNLIENGKYLKQVQGGYRILLLSENREQVERYMTAAIQKNKLAMKLLKNSPASTEFDPDKVRLEVSLAARQKAIREKRAMMED